MQLSRLQNQSTPEMLKKELLIYENLAKVYAKLIRNKKFPFARDQELAYYRDAAVLDDMNAQYILGKKLLEEAKLRDILQQSELFTSESNAFFMNELYKEAHAFLLEAEKKQHINAKRIRGLCYINGWGVPVNKDLEINQSSFFSELFQHRKG